MPDPISSAAVWKVVQAALKRAVAAGKAQVAASDLGQAARTTVFGARGDVAINVINGASSDLGDGAWIEALVVRCYVEIAQTPGLSMTVTRRVDGELVITFDHHAAAAGMMPSDGRRPAALPAAVRHPTTTEDSAGTFSKLVAIVPTQPEKLPVRPPRPQSRRRRAPVAEPARVRRARPAAGRAPSEPIAVVADDRTQRAPQTPTFGRAWGVTPESLGRDDFPCPCGSGKKFTRCHAASIES